MFDARIALTKITYSVPDIYNTNEGRVVKKMKSKYAN
jgi:hypothetical protein